MIFSLQQRDIKKSHQGFGVMELIISIAVFSMVIIAVGDIMVKVFQAQAKAIAVKDVFDNGRFLLELITRELRTGSNIQFTSSPPSGCPSNGLEFTSYNQGSAQERFYYLQDTDGDSFPDALMRVVMPSAGSVDCTVAVPQQFSSDEVVVESLGRNIVGNQVGPLDGQPRVTLTIALHSRNPRVGVNTMIKLQTTIVQRLRDL